MNFEIVLAKAEELTRDQEAGLTKLTWVSQISALMVVFGGGCG